MLVSDLRTVVFDLDDTLYPERDYVLSGFRAVAAWADQHLGIAAESGFAELEALFLQGVRGATFDRWLSTHGVAPQAYIPQLVGVYRDHQPRLRCFPEVPDLLRSLQQRYRLGLLSDGYLGVQQRKLEALGLRHHFAAVLFTDELGRQAWKPSPQGFQALLDRLDVTGPQAVYVADNPLKDFIGARRCGLATIRVAWQSGEYGHLQPATPDHAADVTVTSLAMLKERLLAEKGNVA